MSKLRFPLLDQLNLPCVLERIVPGKLHTDGQRYLPQLLLRPTTGGSLFPAGMLLNVVDRHHLVDPARVGQAGNAHLLCALSSVRLQQPPQRQGLIPEPRWRKGVSYAPQLLGRVLELATWEEQGHHLPYRAVYLELSLDIGIGVIGLRTSLTAADLAADLGTEQIKAGDYLALERSRIDILGFGTAWPDSVL